MKNREFQDGIGLDCTARVPREDRPARSQGQVPYRGGEEGAEEAQLCRMEEEEPKAKVRHCDQQAQVLFAARGTLPRNPLRKSHLVTPHFTNLFGLQYNLQKKKANKVLLYNNYVEVFEDQ